jgi:hypothetical protein
MNGNHDGYWVRFVDTRVLLERNGSREALTNPQRYGLMVDVNQGVHSVGSERYASTN